MIAYYDILVKLWSQSKTKVGKVLGELSENHSVCVHVCVRVCVRMHACTPVSLQTCVQQVTNSRWGYYSTFSILFAPPHASPPWF